MIACFSQRFETEKALDARQQVATSLQCQSGTLSRSEPHFLRRASKFVPQSDDKAPVRAQLSTPSYSARTNVQAPLDARCDTRMSDKNTPAWHIACCFELGRATRPAEQNGVGMSSISGISTIASLSSVSNSSQTSNSRSNFNLFQQLATALQSGNLTAAQQAYSSLASSLQNSSSAQSSNPLSADFTALGQALQSGNLSAAQQAFSNLQQAAVQQFGGVEGHHHHHGGGGAEVQSSLSTDAAPDSIFTSPSSSTSSTSSTDSGASTSQTNDPLNALNLLA